MDITVVGKNKYLWQKIRLCLPECSVEFSESAPLAAVGTVIYDADTAECDVPRGAVTVSRRGEATLQSPFSEGDLRRVLFGTGKSRLRLALSDRCAYLDGEQIRLTEVEFALLKLLYDKEGGFATREEIISRVWHSAVTESAVNVYIHYLREKLERSGEKLIFSSRKEGYRLSEALMEVRS